MQTRFQYTTAYYCAACTSFYTDPTYLSPIHRRDILPYSKEDRARITVRRKFILQDSLHKLRNGLDLTKHLRVVFIGKPAVDDGGPLHEFLYRLIVAVSHSDMLLLWYF